jgi:hypothetical protein
MSSSRNVSSSSSMSNSRPASSLPPLYTSPSARARSVFSLLYLGVTTTATRAQINPRAYNKVKAAVASAGSAAPTCPTCSARPVAACGEREQCGSGHGSEQPENSFIHSFVHSQWAGRCVSSSLRNLSDNYSSAIVAAWCWSVLCCSAMGTGAWHGCWVNWVGSVTLEEVVGHAACCMGA